MNKVSEDSNASMDLFVVDLAEPQYEKSTSVINMMRFGLRVLADGTGKRLNVVLLFELHKRVIRVELFSVLLTPLSVNSSVVARMLPRPLTVVVTAFLSFGFR